jgi:hypothetical protein
MLETDQPFPGFLYLYVGPLSPEPARENPETASEENLGSIDCQPFQQWSHDYHA